MTSRTSAWCWPSCSARPATSSATCQDRIAAEASLATATQRGSVVRHARLVDYEPRPATSARTLLQLDVTGGDVPAGLVVEAPLPDGGRVAFELGDGLDDTGPMRTDPRWNRLDHGNPDLPPRIVPYLWDDAQRCLPAGATQLWVAGHGFGFPVGDPQLGTTGIALLIDTAAPTPADPPVREVVHLTGAFEELDPLYQAPVTRLVWDTGEALTAEHALDRTVLAGNLVPASQGRRTTPRPSWSTRNPEGPDAGLAAVTRTGPDAGCGDPVPVYLHTLTAGRLAWLAGEASGDALTPQIQLARRAHPGGPAPGLGVAPLAAGRRPVRARVHGRARRLPRHPAGADRGAAAVGVRRGRRRLDPVRHRHVRRPALARLGLRRHLPGHCGRGNVLAGAIAVVAQGFDALVVAAADRCPATGGADKYLDSVRAATTWHISGSRNCASAPRTTRPPRAGSLPWVMNARAQPSLKPELAEHLHRARPGHAWFADRPTVDEQRDLVELLGRRRMVAGSSRRSRSVGLRPVRSLIVVLLATILGAARWRWRRRSGQADGQAARHGDTHVLAPGRMRLARLEERRVLAPRSSGRRGRWRAVVVPAARRFVPELVPDAEMVTSAATEIIRVSATSPPPGAVTVLIVVEGGK